MLTLYEYFDRVHQIKYKSEKYISNKRSCIFYPPRNIMLTNLKPSFKFQQNIFGIRSYQRVDPNYRSILYLNLNQGIYIVNKNILFKLDEYVH